MNIVIFLDAFRLLSFLLGVSWGALPWQTPSPEALHRVPASQSAEQAEAPWLCVPLPQEAYGLVGEGKLQIWSAANTFSNLNKRKVILAETVKYMRLAAEIKLL